MKKLNKKKASKKTKELKKEKKRKDSGWMDAREGHEQKNSKTIGQTLLVKLVSKQDKMGYEIKK